ncbi:MAG TPA: segregation/condensation protein A [Chitinophagaceae bacterium]
MNNTSYQIKLPQFEGPFDLLLFFIERDELDIYNIPITGIINDFLAYIHEQETLNIELSSEFILFISTLMRIKAKMLLPRKELDAQGNEIDPRQELVNKILEYKRFKEASAQMAEMEALRMLMVKRGNIQRELSSIGEDATEGTEIQHITLFKLMKAFEKAMQKYSDRMNKPVHTVVQYNYTMESSRQDMLSLAQSDRTVSFEKIFERSENRVHAIFLFLSLLELVQQKFLKIMIGEGKNNFIIEYNEPENRLAEMEDDIQPL